MSNADRSAAEEPNPRVLSPARTPTRPFDTPVARHDEESPRTPQDNPRPFKPVPAVPALAQPRKPAQSEHPSLFQRSLGALRMALPVMQKMLPLLEGNVATAVSNMLAPSPQGQMLDLTPLESALDKMHGELRGLRTDVTEQSTLLKRVGDQVDLVKEAADRIALEQQEMVEDLHSLRKRVTAFAWVGLVLLVASMILNMVLLLRMQRVLP